ncbi:hypothetical protein HPP92_008217 [Vanilla planifolia]|uniref:RIN4 pathogenic type III effector avirulence factor Avr cleavage site domain-containing protein n=1 Tax=Vanilla planifolia TaxID=51239 RepID=A0A835RI01_VANPL|nr:hypothetical protein HPP92_008217 [Vanilla planifolia]
MHNLRVPKFGNWENDRSVPYTQYFDKARKGKSSTKLINPNDPLQNPEAFYDIDIPVHNLEASPMVKHSRHKVQEEVNTQKAVSSMTTEASSANKHASNQPKQQRERELSGDHRRRTSRNNSGQEPSVERSPHHPRLHVRAASKGGVFSPSREKRSSLEKHGLAPSTPGRTKMKPDDRRSNHSLDKGSAVPKFGEWDVMDPASADSYSYIFNQVREEKQSGSKLPSMSRGPFSNRHKQKIRSESTDICCFSCFKI